jgi:hypothetical protein
MAARREISRILKDGPALETLSGVELLRQNIRQLKSTYAELYRSNLETEWLYEAQFQLRFVNSQIRKILIELVKKGKFSRGKQQIVELEAQILNWKDQSLFKSPKKSLPIQGVKGSDWPLSRWEKDKEFYQYNFDGDDILFRGLRLRSGDVLLNHPVEKPVGIFTAISEKRSVFAHAAIIVVLRNKLGRLPVVVDIHERGVRAVPLHHFLSPEVIGYGEIFRLQNTTAHFEVQVDQAIRLAMSEEHPYDLTGSEDRKALSCTELVSYFLELIGQEKLEMKDQIADKIYHNILRFGRLDYQKFQAPNDVFMDSRFQYIGYIDNTQALEIQVSNEVLLDLFREKMLEKIVASQKSLSRVFGEVAIDQVRNRYSLFGGFILGATGFKRENFPVGDPSLLTAVNAIDHSFNKAMTRCLGLAERKNPSVCFRQLNKSLADGLEKNDYSIHRWKSELPLRVATNSELREFDQMFE